MGGDAAFLIRRKREEGKSRRRTRAGEPFMRRLGFLRRIPLWQANLEKTPDRFLKANLVSAPELVFVFLF